MGIEIEKVSKVKKYDEGIISEFVSKIGEIRIKVKESIEEIDNRLEELKNQNPKELSKEDKKSRQQEMRSLRRQKEKAEAIGKSWEEEKERITNQLAEILNENNKLIIDNEKLIQEKTKKIEENTIEMEAIKDTDPDRYAELEAENKELKKDIGKLKRAITKSKDKIQETKKCKLLIEEWHKDLTPEQVEDAISKGIYEAKGPEYEQFLMEHGITKEQSKPKTMETERSSISVTPEVTPEVETEVAPEVTPEVAPEVEPEVAPEVTPEVEPEVAPEVTPEVAPEVEPEVTSEVEPEVTPEVAPEATPEVTPEVAPEVTPEVAPEATPEVTPEVAPEVAPEATTEVTPEVEPEVAPEVTPEVEPEVAPEVTPEVTSEVAPEVAPAPGPRMPKASRNSSTPAPASTAPEVSESGSTHTQEELRRMLEEQQRARSITTGEPKKTIKRIEIDPLKLCTKYWLENHDEGHEIRGLEYTKKHMRTVKKLAKNTETEGKLDPNIIVLITSIYGDKSEEVIRQYLDILSGKGKDNSGFKIVYNLRDISKANLTRKERKNVISIAKAAKKASKGLIEVERDSLLKRMFGGIKNLFSLNQFELEESRKKYLKLAEKTERLNDREREGKESARGARKRQKFNVKKQMIDTKAAIRASEIRKEAPTVTSRDEER